jgi:acetylornithine/N-succinyldiaminopimelate aminotransferase
MRKKEQPLPENTTDWKALEQKLYMRVVNRVPLTLVRGEGLKAWDSEGKEYLDFVGGWAVNSLGHCHPVIIDALEKQSRKIIQTSNQFYSIPQLELAELLIANCCLDRVFFCNSGAEANEGAIKLARRYGKLKLNGAFEIITTQGSFHGRTLAMVAATGQNTYQQPYIPLPNGFINVDYNDMDAIKKATTDNTCAVMLEPVQGEGGVNVPSKGYLKEIRDWCDSNNLLLILDEIQTGIGRMGTLFCYEQYDVEPDIMTLAKGLGGGVPIGAILAKEHVSVFTPGDHGSTYGGNPLICAVSLATLKYIIDNNVSGNAKKMGQYFRKGLEQLKSNYSFVTEVRGEGLLLAIAFNDNFAPEMLQSCLEKGLLVNAVKPNMLRFMPPLIVTEKEIDAALTILNEVLKSRMKNDG